VAQAATSTLQASLFSAQPSATAFGFLRLLERATVAATFVAAATVVTAAAIEISTARVATAIEAVRRRATEIAPLTRGPGPVLRNIQTQVATTDFASVELLDCLGGMLFSCEPDECEPPRAAGLAVLGNVNINYLADLSKELTQLFVGRCEVEVPYEYLA